jgi:hypothetical protein
MRPPVVLLMFILSLALTATDAAGQSSFDFDVAKYEAFLASHSDISSSQLLTMHPAGTFERSIPALSQQPRYLDSIDLKYALTKGEKILLGTNGFVVTERIKPESFGQAFLDIWGADLPVFISTDAILHALHMSYDEILKRTEETYLIPKLRDVLLKLHGKLSILDQKYRSNPAMMPSLMDLDLFITVARALLDGQCTSYYAGNAEPVATVMLNIKSAYIGSCAPLFADNIRTVDYSQFSVRGHYTQSEELSRYFQSMIWLGRTEFYLAPPDDSWKDYTKAQIQRQAVAALLFAEASTLAGTDAQSQEIDNLLGFFVGEPDNVTLKHLNGLCSDLGMQSASELLDTLRYNAFHDMLMTKSWAYQRILSQILCGDPFKPGGVQPASAFIPLGQRFVIDSYVSGKVVYDKISYEGVNVWRELPSPLDVMFALGNDAAGQLLVSELDRYHYADNLASLRYLIDSYESEYWQQTFFNGWLNALRALNPPKDRAVLPSFMKTAAWWQEKMNTQLASWAQLRHDNILYAKQSYTGAGACSYPCGYVEPIPSFYGRIDTLMRVASTYFRHGPSELQYFADYFDRAAQTCSTLTCIAQKEIDRTALSSNDNDFLSKTMFLGSAGCVRSGMPNGWYHSLFFNEFSEMHVNLVVADVHTCPTDQVGNPIGWVLHVGTGPVNMAVVVADVPDIGPSAYVGPVMSFYQRVTTQFKRLTDEEWVTEYGNAPSFRPSWVNAYLADKSGNVLPSGDMLLTGVALPSRGGTLPTDIVLEQNYPNPFNPSTTIRYGLPGKSHVTLTVFNTLGQQIAVLISREEEAGYHGVKFEGSGLSSGVYFYRLQAGDFVATKRLLLLK